MLIDHVDIYLYFFSLREGLCCPYKKQQHVELKNPSFAFYLLVERSLDTPAKFETIYDNRDKIFYVKKSMKTETKNKPKPIKSEISMHSD